MPPQMEDLVNFIIVLVTGAFAGCAMTLVTVAGIKDRLRWFYLLEYTPDWKWRVAIFMARGRLKRWKCDYKELPWQGTPKDAITWMKNNYPRTKIAFDMVRPLPEEKQIRYLT
jgi:hypothetical protein